MTHIIWLMSYESFLINIAIHSKSRNRDKFFRIAVFHIEMAPRSELLIFFDFQDIIDGQWLIWNDSLPGHTFQDHPNARSFYPPWIFSSKFCKYKKMYESSILKLTRQNGLGIIWNTVTCIWFIHPGSFKGKEIE